MIFKPIFIVFFEIIAFLNDWEVWWLSWIFFSIATLLFIWLSKRALLRASKFVIWILAFQVLMFALAFGTHSFSLEDIKKDFPKLSKNVPIFTDKITKPLVFKQFEISKNFSQDTSYRYDNLISHPIWWKDYQKTHYFGRMEVWESDYLKSKENRENIELGTWNDRVDYWTQIYSKMIQFDQKKLERTVQNYRNLQKKYELDRIQLAKAVVSSIQRLPYVLIHDASCYKFMNEHYAYYEMHKGIVCQNHTKFGMQSPVEFMYNLRGDCDTRTLFLFTILGKLGYKVAIINSYVYFHSVLGIQIPYHGKYKMFKGKKYYFWETTAKNWAPGQISPKMSNPKHWQVMIAN